MSTAHPRDSTTALPSVALVDDLAAAIESALGGKPPRGLRELVGDLRVKAAHMSPPEGLSRSPKELAAIAKDLDKDLDTLEDILEAFVLFPSPLPAEE